MKAFISNTTLSAILILSTVCTGASENPNVGNSFGGVRSTVPSQGQARRLLTRPNPMDATGNDVVTGNVGGLRYFHGVVPYGSQYYNSTSLNDYGSESVSSFLRQSTNPVLSDRNPAESRVYFQPRRTVSSFYVQNGHRTALSESESILQGQPRRSPIASSDLTNKMPLTESVERPLSTNNRELDQILARQFELKTKAKESARESILDTQSKFKNFFEVVNPETVEKPAIEEPFTQQSIEDLQKESLPQQQPEQTPESKTTEGNDQNRIASEPLLPIPERLPMQPGILEQQHQQPSENEPAETEQPTNTENASPMGQFLERADLHAEAERILGEHPTLQSLSKAKFSDYMHAAEEFMRNGQFYKAADTYSLATVWISDDPRPYAGQAFALFAAGEYMSSAYYLSRAIEMDPAFIKKKYNLVELIGDRDVFENRLIEMTTWQQRSNSGELAFLMAYVLYQDGKTTRAISSIQRAEEKMPENKAVSILKDVIMPSTGTTP